MTRAGRRIVPLAALALVLAACGGTPTPPADDTVAVEGRPYTVFDVQPAFALALVFAEPGVFASGADAMAPQAIEEFQEGLWVGPFGYVDDGVATMEFPDSEEIPVPALVPLAGSFVQFAGEPTCAPTVDPVAARATATLFQLFGVPGVAALTVEGIALSFATDVPLDEGFDPNTFEGVFYTWLYVDRDATFATPETCTAYDVVLELDAGWNQVAWDVSGSPNLVARSVPLSPFHALPTLPIGATAQ